MVSVVHLTSAHQRYDTRIFLKECRSLARAGFDVSLVVADGLPDEEKDGVNIYGVEKALGRIDRMRDATRRVYRKAILINADIYHLHDPELMPIGLKLKKQGKKVVFDAHEDFPLQLLNKFYSKKWVLWVLSKMAAIYEVYACRKFDAIVAATPTIEQKFKKINHSTISVNNFPVIDEIVSERNNFQGLTNFCYVGALGKVRGVYELIETLTYCPEELNLLLAGRFFSKEVEFEIKGAPQWERVQFYGFVDRFGVAEIYQNSFAGLVTLHPISNYLDALPVKMFEYMGAGLPVIASDIPLWRSIISEVNCGICVNPLNPKEIANALEYLYRNPDQAEEMGRNGQIAVQRKYNWAKEEMKLIGLYNSIGDRSRI